MWLTSRELSEELHVSTKTIPKWRQQRKIRFIKLGNQYRYELPRPTEADIIPQIERIAFLNYAEVAQILGMRATSPVRLAVHEKRLIPVRVGRRKFFTVKEVRRFLALRENRRGQAKQYASRILLDWVRHYLIKDDVPVQVLDSLLKEASAKLPEPERSQAITDLWNLFDSVDDIMRKIKSGPDIRASGF